MAERLIKIRNSAKVCDHNRRFPKRLAKSGCKMNLKGKNYFIKQSNRKNKQLVATDLKTGNKVHFGDPNMPEFSGTKREDSFCARTYNQRDGKGNLTRNNPQSANFYNRRVTWRCRGKKGVTK